MKESATQKVTLSMSRILEERQEDFSSLRNHYKLLEKAISGTNYVQDIQERILKASADVDQDKAVLEDAELIRQIDTIKQTHAEDQSHLKILKSENAELKTDLAKVNQALTKATQSRNEPGPRQIIEKVVAKEQPQTLQLNQQNDMRNLVIQIQADHSKALEAKLQEVVELRSTLQRTQ